MVVLHKDQLWTRPNKEKDLHLGKNATQKVGLSQSIVTASFVKKILILKGA